MKTTSDRSLLVIVAVLNAWFGAGVSNAQPARDPVHASVTLSSAYLHNGLPQTEDDVSLRFTLDFEHPTGFFAGGSLANVDYTFERQPGPQRDTQAAVYTGFVWRRGDWMSNVSLSRYLYPGFVPDYDYSQIALNLSFRERFFVTGSRSSDYLSVYGTAEQFSAGLALPIAAGIEFSATAGRFRSKGFFDVSYSHWDAGLSRPIGPIALDLRYHANTYSHASPLGNDDTGLWVISMTYTLLPIRNQAP